MSLDEVPVAGSETFSWTDILRAIGVFPDHRDFQASLVRLTGKIVEVVGNVDAAETGFKRASKTLRGITGMRLMEATAAVSKNKITEYRVRMKVTFVLDE